jgi:antitoxin (DNA-binding transcriptional repressor) of toxin-antitoxin stability system
MRTISTSRLRSRTRSLVRALENGTSVSLTYRGHKLANIRPLKLNNGVRGDDPLYRFHRFANKSAKPLTDLQIDSAAGGMKRGAVKGEEKMRHPR